MRIYGLHVFRVLAVAAVLFALLAGGQYLFQRQGVERPLLDVYRGEPAVESYRLGKENGRFVAYLRLTEVPNLQEAYLRLERQTMLALGGREFTLVIEDRRDGYLEEALYDMHYALQEGAETGRFSDMAQRVREKARDLDLDRYRLYVDGRHIYLQLHRDGRYLYEVLPREADGQPQPVPARLPSSSEDT